MRIGLQKTPGEQRREMNSSRRQGELFWRLGEFVGVSHMMDGQLGAFYTQKIPKIPFSVSTCPGGGVDTLSQIENSVDLLWSCVDLLSQFCKQAILGTESNVDLLWSCVDLSSLIPGICNSCRHTL
ncbi:hypothetical protein Taro_021480 [Colocasia esculenta]|uniref:Uncharacterized protein n=1 Tax=Colocasia esculenta TaxID=4460 RepID=A0A843V8B8_COLES|nr:hypothetical protein [Colocasia esculenta]